MKVTEEPPKPPSNNEIRSAINTLSLHSVFVGQDCVEKITKHTRNDPASLLERSFFARDILNNHLRPTSLSLRVMWI